MNLTIITHFNDKGYRRLHSLLAVAAGEKICRVPYGRVDNSRRYGEDTLPYHLTISSTKMPLCQLMHKLDRLRCRPFAIRITGLGIMPGKEHSQVLFFKVAPSPEINHLQSKMYDLIGNEKYLPGKNTLHITICINKDVEKIRRIHDKITAVFTPFDLTVASLGIYEIWPGKLKAEFHFSEHPFEKDMSKKE